MPTSKEIRNYIVKAQAIILLVLVNISYGILKYIFFIFNLEFAEYVDVYFVLASIIALMLSYKYRTEERRQQEALLSDAQLSQILEFLKINK